MKKIQNIIVPIDFSVNARNAYQYAKNLAHTLGATVTVININEHTIMASDVVVSSFPIKDSDMIIEIEKFVSEENLNLSQEVMQTKTKVNYLTGDSVSVLIELSEREDVDLIVMGSSGLEDILSKIVGTDSHKVSNKAHCPVILIPRNVKWQPIKQIMYASNYDSLQESSLKEIMSFAKDLFAEIHFVNVKNYDPLFEPKQEEINWDKLFELNILNQPFHKHTIYGNDTAEELNNYCDEKNIDMMAFFTKHRNFWQSLMHKSITENAALLAIIPLLIVHIDDIN